MIKIDPQIYNLPSRVKLFEDSKKNIFISIDRKSRIVMKDGLRILEIVNNIKKKKSNQKVNLLTSAPICSKTITFLTSNNIFIKTLG